jgi:uncharacterized DUF497 family protein
VETAFEWDAVKAASNLRKHGVSFEVARLAFADPRAVFEQDRIVEGEERWQAIGMVRATTVLSVTHLWYETEEVSTIRIISARRANRRERRAYEEQDGKNYD